MAHLLETLHSAGATELQLKADILKALLLCLRDSHRTRTAFRKVRHVYSTASLSQLKKQFSYQYQPSQRHTDSKMSYKLHICISIHNLISKYKHLTTTLTQIAVIHNYNTRDTTIIYIYQFVHTKCGKNAL